MVLFVAAAFAGVPPLTLSQSILELPDAETSLELGLARRFGALVVGGYGIDDTHRTRTIGLQARTYPIGRFDRGLVLGLGAAWSRRTSRLLPESGASSQVPLSLFVGPKVRVAAGLTAEVTLGARALATHGSAYGHSFTQWQLVPHLNMQLGWTR